MNEVAEVTTPERLETLAVEIRTIQENARRIMLTSTIAIGERLAEAKDAVGHGGWLGWLESNTNISERHAQRAMRMWKEYGQGQQQLFGKMMNEEALVELTTVQAEILLGIKDADERAEFIENHDVGEMTTRELQEAVKAKEEIEAAMKKVQETLVDNRALLESQGQMIKTLKEQQNLLGAELHAKKEESAALKSQIEEMKNISLETTVIEKIPAEVEEELATLRDKANRAAVGEHMSQFKVHLLVVRDQVKAMETLAQTMPPEDRETAVNALYKIGENIQDGANKIQTS
ncbi:DUF3102 domain-containing protein [Selenomonas sp. F0473]|uniref:DUF3102 domain-containing protein n=1 Tax=Selenomonas sp. F0473 TaxID=999423 RepID=UPI0025E54FAB|nr:DUF3102 domain-containing protein [Selenomonas sp. F0473]